MSTESMYQEIILDHYKNPQHHGLSDPFDAEVHHVNSISQASTSVMTGLVIGAEIDAALDLERTFLELMHSRGNASLSEADADRLDDAVAFEGVAKYPARVKCALLGWMAMKSAVAEAGHPITANGATKENS